MDAKSLVGAGQDRDTADEAVTPDSSMPYLGVPAQAIQDGPSARTLAIHQGDLEGVSVSRLLRAP